MRRLSALVSMLMESSSAPIAIAFLFAVSVLASNEIVNQGASVPALPRRPKSTTPSPVSSNNPSVLRLPPENESLSLIDNNFPASVQFHVPDSQIDLDITFFGGPLDFRNVAAIVELALEDISPELSTHPTESITNGFFQQRGEGLEIKVGQYAGQQVTWYLLDRVLLGIHYHASQRSRPCELRFEIDVVGKGKVGYGSLWHVGGFGGDGSSNSSDVAAAQKRAVREPPGPPPLSLVSVSKPAAGDLNHSTTTTISQDPQIIFSYHLFGPSMPATTITLCFTRARAHIRPHVRDRPHDAIPDNSFIYSPDNIPVVIGVAAYAGKEISWLFLDRVLRDVERDIINEHLLRECSFEFEVEPFEEAVGYGFLEYSV